MNDINTALIAMLGVLGGAYINNFLAEDFRRFRDGQALAGALAGELESIHVALPELVVSLHNMKSILEMNNSLNLFEFPQPSSPIFEANTQKIGLLDACLAREVSFVYERIRAFRTVFQLISKYHKEMEPERCLSLVLSCIGLAGVGSERIKALVKGLDDHAGKKWKWPKIVKLGLGVFAVVTGCYYLSDIYPAFSDWLSKINECFVDK